MNESDENNDESRGLEGMEVSVAGAWQWQLADNSGPNMGRVERSHRPSPACQRWLFRAGNTAAFDPPLRLAFTAHGDVLHDPRPRFTNPPVTVLSELSSVDAVATLSSNFAPYSATAFDTMVHDIQEGVASHDGDSGL